MNIIDLKNNNSTKNATEVLKSGGVFIFPTDTVYGIGCLMIDKAIKKLYKIKNRPAGQPTAILMNLNIFDSKRIKELVLEPEKEFLAGQLTIIDSIENYAINFPQAIISSDNKIGIRLPNHQWLSQLIDKVGPIVASSANKAGDMPPKNFNEINKKLLDEVDLTVETDQSLLGTPSNIFDLKTQKYIRIR